MKSALQSAGLFLCQDRFWRPNTLLIAIHSSGNEVSAPETLELVIQDELGPLFPADDGIEWAIKNGYFISRELRELHGVTAGTYVHPSNTLSTVTKPTAAKVKAAPVTNPNGSETTNAPAADVKPNADDILSALFDLVTVEALEKMFPAAGKWKKWAEKAKANGLRNARYKRAAFNPYKAALWFMNKGEAGWDLARCNRTLAKNLPARSRDKEHLLTEGID